MPPHRCRLLGVSLRGSCWGMAPARMRSNSASTGLHEHIGEANIRRPERLLEPALKQLEQAGQGRFCARHRCRGDAAKCPYMVSL